MTTLTDRTGIITWSAWREFFAGMEACGASITGEDWNYWSVRMLARMTGLV